MGRVLTTGVYWMLGAFWGEEDSRPRLQSIGMETGVAGGGQYLCTNGGKTVSDSFRALTRQERTAFWQDVEAKINDALKLCAGCVSSGVVKEVREYLDHNELGLAWDVLCRALLASDAVPPEPARRLLLDAGRQMAFHHPQNPGYALWKNVERFFNHRG